MRHYVGLLFSCDFNCFNLFRSKKNDAITLIRFFKLTLEIDELFLIRNMLLISAFTLLYLIWSNFGIFKWLFSMWSSLFGQRISAPRYSIFNQKNPPSTHALFHAEGMLIKMIGVFKYFARTGGCSTLKPQIPY